MGDGPRRQRGRPALTDPLASFAEPARLWFREALGAPTRAQALAWPEIARGASTLLLSPTGSGKTLAAFFAVLDRLMRGAEPARAARCKVIYVSPLKALAVDVERNLRAPLEGILRVAERLGEPARALTIHVRTGDTPMSERAKMRRHPPDILITTPESLYNLVTSNAREVVAHAETIIIDEIHALVPTKRGAHLFVTIERLEALRARPLQRVGLSATQRPLDEVARLLAGFDGDAPRPVAIVDAKQTKPLEISVAMPEADADGREGRSVWPKVHEDLVRRIRAHRTTMIFVNSRRLAERLASALNELAGEELALAHHGSVAREKRSEIEARLKAGELPAIVATSSLELGIDMGSVDLVVQIEAPLSVASGLQRIGRASHNVGGTPRGVILPKHKGDLIACAAVTPRMRQGLVEETFYPRNPLDVLAQQLVAIASADDEGVDVDALYTLIRRAAPYAELPRSSFDGVLDMLSGRYPSADFAGLRPRLVWDRKRGLVKPREGARMLAIQSGGTIPDRGLYGVFLEGGDARRGGTRVGELDEEMVFELSEGEVFLLGATAWRASEITHDRVLVTPAAGEPGKMPFWHGDRPGRPRELGAAIGALVRDLAGRDEADAIAVLRTRHDLDASAAAQLALHVKRQREATGDVPSDRTILVERYLDEVGDFRVCVLSPFGMRVHAPWGQAVLARLRAAIPGEVDGVWADDGMVFRVPASDRPPPTELFFPRAKEVLGQVTDVLAGTSLFATRFRENAARALLLPRRGRQLRTPLWAQRKRSADLLAVAARHPSFPILLETYRECLREVFDVPGLEEILRQIEQRTIRVLSVATRAPSPFAATLVFGFVANFIYDGDAPVAERRIEALAIDHAQLRELLGEAELRALLDPEIVAEHARTLQRLPYPAKHANGVHDLLLMLGDLTRAELAARTEGDAGAFVDALVADKRAAVIRLADEERLIAAEDAARYRDGLGVALPRGLPKALLAKTADARDELVRRYARTHGPFTAGELAARFGLAPEALARDLARLVDEGALVAGAFRPEGTGEELCDADVLQALRRRSLAALRRTVEPVDPAVFARFLPDWQGLARRTRGADGLLAVLAQLEGCPVAASALEQEILPARVEGYTRWQLDELCASGEVVWAGLEPVGTNDGRVVLFRADHEGRLGPPPGVAEGPVAASIRALLERRGAVFFPEIARAVGGYPNDVLRALWAMVWAGEVANDTLEPLRSLRRGEAKATGRERRQRTRPTRGALPGSEGRWSLRAARLAAATPTERGAALAQALLERYGIVTREAAQAEGIEGGFSAVYPVLKAMEEAGRVRRGYFVEGRGGAQFALPGADERLRAMRALENEEHDVRVLAAIDPANAYGALLPWPEAKAEGARPQRAPGAHVVLHRGALIAFVARGDESVTTFFGDDDAAAHAFVEALGRLLDGPRDERRRALLVKTIDGAPAREHALAARLLARGFVPGGEGGLLLRARLEVPMENL